MSQPGKTDASGVAPRVIGTYKASKDVNLNAQISRGFRLGGVNDPLNMPLCTPQDLATFGGRETWDDEKVWNYEFGVKSRVLNGGGAFNVAGFYADINDLQATVTAGSVFLTRHLQRSEFAERWRRDRVRGGAHPQFRLRDLRHLRES